MEGIIRHTAVIPYGGNVITQDIRKGCKILEVYAEKLVCLVVRLLKGVAARSCCHTDLKVSH